MVGGERGNAQMVPNGAKWCQRGAKRDLTFSNVFLSFLWYPQNHRSLDFLILYNGVTLYV